MRIERLLQGDVGFILSALAFWEGHLLSQLDGHIAGQVSVTKGKIERAESVFVSDEVGITFSAATLSGPRVPCVALPIEFQSEIAFALQMRLAVCADKILAGGSSLSFWRDQRQVAERALQAVIVAKEIQ